MWNLDCRGTIVSAISDLRKLLQSYPEESSRIRRKRAAVSDLIDHLEQEARRSYLTERLWTPFPSLDDSIGRFLPGRMYAFLGGPAVGKSTLAIQFADHLLGVCEQRTALFSSHLRVDRLVRGLVVARSRCGMPGTGKRWVSESMVSAISNVAAQLADGRVEMLCEPQATFTDLEVLLEVFGDGPPPSVLIVDGLTSSMLGNDFGVKGVDRALGRLRKIAEDRQVAVLVFLGWEEPGNREAWNPETGRHPNRLQIEDPSDLDADLVCGIWEKHCTEEWGQSDEVECVTRLTLLKNAFGLQVGIALEFDDDNLVFDEVEEAPTEEDNDE